MAKKKLFKYQLISPSLPVGGFCYSEGMESFLKRKKLDDHNAIKDLIVDELNFGQIRIDSKSLLDFVDLYKCLHSSNHCLKYKYRIISLNKWLIALRDSKEIRDQQRQMARSLLDLSKNLGFEFPFQLEKNISWPLAWSWLSFCSEIDRKEMVENFIFSWTANQLSAAIRLIPMGSTKAQIIQYELLDKISNLASEIIKKDLNEIYISNISLSMAQQSHGELYTKLFRN